MRITLLAFLFFAFQGLSAQTVTGIVKDKATGLPLPFANVFVNNTTQGLATDKVGKFRLSGDFPAQIELVASFVGYMTEVKSIYFKGNESIEVVFELVYNESNLSEIELRAKRDKTWERNLKVFESVFLALPDDPYKSQIEITNPWVIDFEKVNVKNGLNYLKASSQEPIKIFNYALGYEITYYLQDFRLLRNGFRYLGQVFYEPFTSLNIRTLANWEKVRQTNYLGSLQQLNQSILLNTPDSTYFALFKTTDPVERNRTNDFYEELNKTIFPVLKDSILRRPLGDGTFRVFLRNRLEIHHLGQRWSNDYYTSIFHPISWIQAPEGYYDIDRNGSLIDPTQLVVSGYFGRKRVARSLPLDFKPLSGFALGERSDEIIVELTQPKLNRLREKVWLTTNKPYYYAGETAWIGGRILYQEPFLADSLSRVVHVELIREQSGVVQTATFPILQGKISGGMVLPKDIVPGDYLLRAYTNWNLNFPETDQFVAPILVMEQGFRPISKEEEVEEYPEAIQIKAGYQLSDSVNYRSMDLRLEFLDEYENAIDGSFVLSITDPDEVTELKHHSRVGQVVSWLDGGLPDAFQSKLSHPVAYGISLRGKYKPENKRQPLITPITIVRGDLEDYGQVFPDSAGNFWATGLVFRDSASIAISAVNEKLRPFGSVELLPLGKPNLPAVFPKLDYSKTVISSGESPLDLSGDYILLEEFVKEAPRVIETMADINYGYGTADREVNEDQLFRLSTEAINGLLGLSNLANYNYGVKTSAPLLIIDGVQYPHLSPEDFGEIMKNFVSYAELKSIKVYTFSAHIFGMAGYSGVLMIETKKGSREKFLIDRKFNAEGFQVFSIAGFNSFPVFPQSPPADKFLRKKPTIYWEPNGVTQEGIFNVNIKIPYGINRLRFKLEGVTGDGEPFDRVIESIL
jgi:hypothetical protein